MPRIRMLGMLTITEASMILGILVIKCNNNILNIIDQMNVCLFMCVRNCKNIKSHMKTNNYFRPEKQAFYCCKARARVT